MNVKKYIIRIMNWVVPIAFIIFMLYSFEYGVIGLITYYIIYSLFMLWVARDQFIMIKHHVETLIWKKPLKDFKKGELANTKVKIKWRREGNMIIKTNDQLETEATQNRMYYQGIFFVSIFCVLLALILGNMTMVYVSLYLIIIGIYPLIAMSTAMIRLEQRGYKDASRNR